MEKITRPSRPISRQVNSIVRRWAQYNDAYLSALPTVVRVLCVLKRHPVEGVVHIVNKNTGDTHGFPSEPDVATIM